jgi:hypothetical protein
VIKLHFVVYLDHLKLHFLWILAIGHCILLGNRVQSQNVFVLKPLSPQEIALVKGFFLRGIPPISVLKDSLDQHVIVSWADVILRSCGLDLLRIVIGLIHVRENHGVHLVFSLGEEFFVLHERYKIILVLLGYLNSKVSNASI